MMSRMIPFSAVLIFGFGLVLPAIAFEEDNVVAKVGGISITKFDVARKIERILPMYGGFHKGVSKEKREKAQGKAIENLIEQALKTRFSRVPFI